MKNFFKNATIVFVLSILPNFIIGIIRLKREEPIPYVLNKMKLVNSYSGELSMNDKPFYVKPIGDLNKLPLFKGDSVWRRIDNFRFSNVEINKSPEILFLGDSFLNYSATNTAKGIQALTNKLFNKNISYNIGAAYCAGFSVYNRLSKSTFKKKPRLIIFEVVERNSFAIVTNAPNELRSNHLVPYRRLYYFDLLFGNNFKGFDLRRIFQTSPLKNNRVPEGVVHDYNGKKVWFLNNRITPLSNESLNNMVDSMAVVEKMLEAQNIKIVFVIAPDKESIYSTIFGQSTLKALHSRMKERNLNYIDMLSLLENKGEKYYLDGDTHWNEHAVRLLSEEVAKKYRHYFLNGN